MWVVCPVWTSSSKRVVDTLMCCRHVPVPNVYLLYTTAGEGWNRDNAFLELLNVTADSLRRDGGVEDERDDETVQTLALVELPNTGRGVGYTR